MRKLIIMTLSLNPILLVAQGNWEKKFEQLGTELPTPNTYRTASGAPGSDYWQQKVDYDIDIQLNDFDQTIKGSETITYTNNSPDELPYLWIQLDQNVRAIDADKKAVNGSRMRDMINGKSLQSLTDNYDFDGGFKIASVTNTNGEALSNLINKTMMRVDLPQSLRPGQKFSFKIDWRYEIQDRMLLGGRSGFEYFPKDDNYLYTIAQFYPRMAVYDNVEGWQNKQFLGNGEFALEFGDFKMNITVPDDFVVAASGELQNPEEVLTETQIGRFKRAKASFDEIVFIITEEEAVRNEKSRATGSQTWTFYANNVRDVAFAASRKFIWDAQAVDINGKTPLAMSFYGKEGNPLWEEQSTKAVVNTLKTYSRMTIDYPYPVAQSVHSASIGMEYPMICFNWGRPDDEGNYSDAKKWATIMVIIHEVGHNFFPMIINSDERQWTWMDEGLNSFIESVTEREHYPNMPLKRGPAGTIVNYMKGDKMYIRPIMTNSEQILQFGNNAYGKPAAALDILRETVMGRELFDYAFKEYSRRWAFKHPTPADFFRTMEDASAVDLDWFWKGWFYTTDHVDFSLDKVKWYKMDVPLSKVENKPQKVKKGKKINGQSAAKNSKMQMPDEPALFKFEDTEEKFYGEFRNRVDDKAVKLASVDQNFYELTFSNKGGLVMPIIIQWNYEDGSQEIQRIPAEIWRKNEEIVTKVFVKEKLVTHVIIDPNLETADVDTENNVFPRKEIISEFDAFERGN